MEFKVKVTQKSHWQYEGKDHVSNESIVAEFDCVEGVVNFVQTMFDNCDSISVEITREVE